MSASIKPTKSFIDLYFEWKRKREEYINECKKIAKRIGIKELERELFKRLVGDNYGIQM